MLKSGYASSLWFLRILATVLQTSVLEILLLL